jgi:excisionase family DNA binding protein
VKKRKEGESHLLTYEQAALYLAVGRTKVFEAVNRGELAAVRMGCNTRFRPEDLEDYIQGRLSVRCEGRWKKCASLTKTRNNDHGS